MSKYPVRLAVYTQLTALLQTVTPANGYVNDLRYSVFRGRTIFGDKDPLPLISILDIPIPPDFVQGAVDNPANNEELHVIIQGFVKDDLENPTDPAHVLFADVRRCLAIEKKGKARPPNLLGMGGLITKMEIGLGTVRPPETGQSNKAFFWQIVILGLVEKLDDPYGWDKPR